jgi:hypothetical protein
MHSVLVFKDPMSNNYSEDKLIERTCMVLLTELGWNCANDIHLKVKPMNKINTMGLMPGDRIITAKSFMGNTPFTLLYFFAINALHARIG